jgi:hypothetical protein
MKRLLFIILSFCIVGCVDGGLSNEGPNPPDSSQTTDGPDSSGGTSGGIGNEGGSNAGEGNDEGGSGNEGNEGGNDKPSDSDKPSDDGGKKPQLNPYEKWEDWIPVTTK